MPATSQAELQAILESLDNRKQAWAALTAAERAQLLRETLKTTIAVCPVLLTFHRACEVVVLDAASQIGV